MVEKNPSTLVSGGHARKGWSLALMVRSAVEYRTLIGELIRVELLAQYKKSFLGLFWVIFNPLMTVVVWLLLYFTGVFNPGPTAVPYPAFVILSVSMWQLFVGLFDQISRSLTLSGPMLTQAAFPHEILVVQKTALVLFNFLLPLLASLVVLLVYGSSFSVSSFLFLPALLPLILFGISLGMLFSIVEVLAVDFYHVAHRIITGLLIYISPVVYSPQVSSPLLQSLMGFNPLSYLIDTPRALLLNQDFSSLTGFWISTSAVVLFFLLSLRIYLVGERQVIERIVV
jgi:lipopolysaccharide transport system permease protein